MLSLLSMTLTWVTMTQSNEPDQLTTAWHYDRDYNSHTAYLKKHYRSHKHEINVERKKTISLLSNLSLSYILLCCLMRSLILSSQCTTAHRVQYTSDNSEIDECWEHRECEQCFSIRQ